MILFFDFTLSNAIPSLYTLLQSLHIKGNRVQLLVLPFGHGITWKINFSFALNVTSGHIIIACSPSQCSVHPYRPTTIITWMNEMELWMPDKSTNNHIKLCWSCNVFICLGTVFLYCYRVHGFCCFDKQNGNEMKLRLWWRYIWKWQWYHLHVHTNRVFNMCSQ